MDLIYPVAKRAEVDILWFSVRRSGHTAVAFWCCTVCVLCLFYYHAHKQYMRCAGNSPQHMTNPVQLALNAFFFRSQVDRFKRTRSDYKCAVDCLVISLILCMLHDKPGKHNSVTIQSSQFIFFLCKM